MRSSTLLTSSRRNQDVAARFGRRAAAYAEHTDLQKQVAAKLARHLPDVEQPNVLEIGCGTGHLTRQLIEKYPDGRFVISDLSEEMVRECRKQVCNGSAQRFDVLDGEWPEVDERFDVIATSMAVHWFESPLAGLERLRGLLRPGGRLLFATLGAESFSEWRAHLLAQELAVGLVDVPEWPGVIEDEKLKVRFDDAASFFRAMKGMGATQPRPGYQPMGAGVLRKALRDFDAQCAEGVSWHIVYGALSAGV